MITIVIKVTLLRGSKLRLIEGLTGSYKKTHSFFHTDGLSWGSEVNVLICDLDTGIV